ncbi:MAG: hypothetical protein HGN29_01565 [Asgard group archaeon]|nr:hypothetical protein [Asgard group archaeon]
MNIIQFFNEVFDKDEVQNIALFFGLSTTGKKAEIIKRIAKSENFDVNELLNHFNRDQLYILCFNLRLPVSGTKKELWNRIVTRFQLDREIPVIEEPEPDEVSPTPQIDEQIPEEKQIVEDKKVDEELHEIADIISNWVPDMRYIHEEGYQAELSSLLKLKHGFKVQKEVGATQIDILVNDTIPIELKKNPNRGDFDRLSGQIIRNIDTYGKLIVVICQLETQELFMEYKSSLGNRYSSEELVFIVKS